MIDLKRKKIEYTDTVKANKYFPSSKDLNVVFEMDNDNPEELFIPLEELFQFSELLEINAKASPLRSIVKGAKYGVQVSLKEKTWWRLHLASKALSEIKGVRLSISQCLDQFFYNSVLSSLSIHYTNGIEEKLSEDFLNEANLVKEKLKFVILAKDKDGNEEFWEDNIPDFTFHLIEPLRELLLILIKPEYSIYSKDDSLINLMVFLNDFVDKNTKSILRNSISNYEFNSKTEDLRSIILNSKIDFISLWEYSKNFKEDYPIYRHPFDGSQDAYINREKDRNLSMLAAVTREGIEAFEKKFNYLRKISPKFGKFKIE